MLYESGLLAGFEPIAHLTFFVTWMRDMALDIRTRIVMKN